MVIEEMTTMARKARVKRKINRRLLRRPLRRRLTVGATCGRFVVLGRCFFARDEDSLEAVVFARRSSREELASVGRTAGGL